MHQYINTYIDAEAYRFAPSPRCLGLRRLRLESQAPESKSVHAAVSFSDSDL